MPRRKKTPLDNPAPQTQSSLMLLAAELRNRIYHLALEETEVLVDTRERRNSRSPGFLLACKQIHAEAIGIFYATGTFTFHDDTQGFNSTRKFTTQHAVWRNRIGHKKADLVRHIRVKSTYHGHDEPGLPLFQLCFLMKEGTSTTMQIGIASAQNWLNHLQAMIELPGVVLEVNMPPAGRSATGKKWSSEPLADYEKAMALKIAGDDPYEDLAC